MTWFPVAPGAVVWLAPDDYVAGASTWTDRAGSRTFALVGASKKENAYTILTANAAPIWFWCPSIAALNTGTGPGTIDVWIYLSTINFGSWRYVAGASAFWTSGGGDFGIYISSIGTTIGICIATTRLKYLYSFISISLSPNGQFYLCTP